MGQARECAVKMKQITKSRRLQYDIVSFTSFRSSEDYTKTLDESHYP